MEKGGWPRKLGITVNQSSVNQDSTGPISSSGNYDSFSAIFIKISNQEKIMGVIEI